MLSKQSAVLCLYCVHRVLCLLGCMCIVPFLRGGSTHGRLAALTHSSYHKQLFLATTITISTQHSRSAESTLLSAGVVEHHPVPAHLRSAFPVSDY